MHMPEGHHSKVFKTKFQPALFCTLLKRAELQLCAELKNTPPAVSCQSHLLFEVKKRVRMCTFPCACCICEAVRMFRFLTSLLCPGSSQGLSKKSL